nr:winged helix-turn-helix transcriptional regulator [Desulfobulbaceae bacterium]
MKSSSDLCGCRVVHLESVVSAKKNALEGQEFGALANLFKALADVNRIKIIWALTTAEMCVCDLAAYLGVTESAVSHQLRTLRQLQLVANRRDGQVLYYRLDDDHMGKLVNLAMEHVREG